MPTEIRQKNRIASLKTPAKQDEFALLKFEATEGLSEIFNIKITATSTSENFDIKEFLSERCYISVSLRDNTDRYFHGIVSDAQWIGRNKDLHTYKFTLKPWLWLLSRRSDCRIFKDKTPIEILKAIFKKEDKANFIDKTQSQKNKIEYCVQYRETDLDFVSRIMEKYGIYYYFKHSLEGHCMILCDSRTPHEMVKAPAEPTFKGAPPSFMLLPPSDTTQRRSEHLQEWSTIRRLRTGRVRLKDYDYTKSTSDLSSNAETDLQKARPYEAYDYPGAYLERDRGEHLAKVRIEAQQALDDRRFASGEVPSLYAGALMALGGHETYSENGNYIVVRATHRFSGQHYRSGLAENETIYSGDLELQRSERPFRAPLKTPAPVIAGLHTARVTGKDNEGTEGDIDVDKFGCILVRFHWDREDKSTSCRVRVAQLWSGKAWGGQIIPRIGQEVIVEFIEGSPDWPLVTGTVVNDQHMPPYELPANKTQSGLKSQSTKGGGHAGTYNEIKFEDLADKEVLGLRAQKDHQVEVLNSETRTIGSAFQGSDFSRKTVLKNGSDKLDVENGKLDITASTEIVMKVGESRIKMLPTSIEITSPKITIKSTLKTEVLSDGTVIVKGGMVLIN